MKMNIFEDRKGNEEVFWKNEIKANMMTSTVIILFSVVNFSISIFEPATFFNNYEYFRKTMFIIGILGCGISFICAYYGGAKKWIKNVLMLYLIISTVIFSLTADTAVITLLFCLPVIISCRYYSRRFTLFLSGISILMTIIMSLVISNFGLSTMPNLNYFVFKEGYSKVVSGYLFNSVSYEEADIPAYLRSLGIGLIMPVIFIFIINTFVCAVVSHTGKNMIIEQAEITKKQEKIETELELASSIQKDMLPIESLNQNYVSVAGKMVPAKNVGGDFYNYFEIDDDHVGFTIGDVSDKGVPASLFMSKCETLVSGYTKIGYPVEAVMDYVNKTLCENNTSGMFVTCLLGIINTKTGEVDCVNAGHCAPLVVTPIDYQYIDIEPDLFLGGFNDIKYTKHHYVLEHGSRIFLYTDGVTESTNSNDEQFGRKRLEESIMKSIQEGKHDLMNNICDDINIYSNNSEQFDDITMLLVDFK